MTQSTLAFRASVFHFTNKPTDDYRNGYAFFEDGLLVVENGFVKQLGSYTETYKTLDPGIPVHDHSGKLIMPGFIDTHIHYPQTDIIASHGKQLIDWLYDYTYPAEMKFKDISHAGLTARFFIEELLRNGTTSALVLPTVHEQSVHAVFTAAEARNLRLVSGKVMMDRNAPPELLDTAEQSYRDAKALIDTWHNRNRLSYAITPRFALTSTEQQLEAASCLMEENQGLLFHTHLSENKKEVQLISRAFPLSRSYLDVYHHFGLTGERSSFAHCIHLDDHDYHLLKETRSSVALCPTSNLFLGSGLFDLGKIEPLSIKTALGTDVGAGTSFSLFKTMAEAYKVCQLMGFNLSVFLAYYMASLGGAEILGLDKKIGNFEKGKEADFIVINPERIPVLKRRIENSKNLEEMLFALMILGDDRIVENSYIMGEKQVISNC